MATAQKLLAAVITNASVIVFREGLQTILILVSLLGSLKKEANRKYRRPLWAGAILALAISSPKITRLPHTLPAALANHSYWPWPVAIPT